MSRSGKYFSERPAKNYKKAVLYVEGVDDAHFVDRILDDLSASPDHVQIIFTGGNTKILPALGIIEKSSEYVRGEVSRVAVITDADRNPRSTLSKLFSEIQKLSFPEPENGTLKDYDSGRKKFGFS